MRSFFSALGFGLLFLAIIGVIAFVIVTIIGLAGSVFATQGYRADVETYFELSDQASDAKTKLAYLEQYREALDKEDLCTGNAKWFFNNPYTDLSRQCGIVDSLIGRLRGVSVMDPQSLEYQQAISQITNQEYRGLDTCVFVRGRNRKSAARFFLYPVLGSVCQQGSR